MHFESAEYYLTYLFFYIFPALDVLDRSLSKFRDSSVSIIAVNNPPVEPIGAKYIDISMQLDENYVEPVHKHFPSMHAPFLLQWYGQLFFD